MSLSKERCSLLRIQRRAAEASLELISEPSKSSMASLTNGC
jgi:hypothetical protein